MTTLRIFSEDVPERPQLATSNFASIQSILSQIGVTLERWTAAVQLPAKASTDMIAEAYRSDIDRLMQDGGYTTWDVVSMQADNPNKETFRKMFLNEHRHAEDEVRFFVDGQGLFTIHKAGRVFELLCEREDLIRVPAGTAHWFDMGPNPRFTAIRLFNNPAGWVAQWTGDDIASRFSRLQN